MSHYQLNCVAELLN